MPRYNYKLNSHRYYHKSLVVIILHYTETEDLRGGGATTVPAVVVQLYTTVLVLLLLLLNNKLKLSVNETSHVWITAATAEKSGKEVSRVNVGNDIRMKNQYDNITNSTVLSTQATTG